MTPTTSLSFFIAGDPQPGGSKKMIPNRKFIGQRLLITSKLIMQLAFIVDDAKGNAKWRRACAAEAKAYMGSLRPLQGPLAVKFTFLMPRPQMHFGTGKNAGQVKARFFEALPVVRPDLTKLVRSTEDALTGIVWKDDDAICWQLPRKHYVTGTQVPGCHVKVWPYHPFSSDDPQAEIPF